MSMCKHRNTHWLQNMGLCVVSVLVVAPMTVAIACAKEEAPSEPEIPAHFTTYTDEANLFSISYPPDWEPLVAQLEEIDEATKELLESIEFDLSLERGVALFAAGIPTETGYDPNVNISVMSLPGGIGTLDENVEANIRGIKDMFQEYREFYRVKTTVDGREAIIVDYEVFHPNLGRVRSLVMNVLVRKHSWVVICNVLDLQKFSDYEEDLYAIVRSLRIFK